MGASSTRWAICGLLFAATTINYLDRATIGVLKPTLMAELKWTETNYGDVVAWFSLAYAVGYGLSGIVIDRIGSKLGYALTVAAWSLAATAHGMARSVVGFSLARAALGLAEGGNFPAAVKAIGEWFPVRERALAVGVVNAGSNIGVILALTGAPILASRFGWPAAFWISGAVGFAWVATWLGWHRAARGDSSGLEGAIGVEVESRKGSTRMSWRELLRHRSVWAFIVGTSLCSPVWWFYLYWSPGFLNAKFGMAPEQIGLPLIVVYLTADVGSVAGGWLSGRLMRRGWSVNAARKGAMLVCALGALPVCMAPRVEEAWLAVGALALAAAANQGFAANLFSLVTDTAPPRAVASIVGLGGMAAGFAAAGFQRATGRILDSWPLGYEVILGVASVIYLAALLCIHLISPRLAPIHAADSGE